MLVYRENLFDIFSTNMRPLNNHSVSAYPHADMRTALKDTKFSKTYYEIHIFPLLVCVHLLLTWNWSRDSSVGTVESYGLDGPG
jgi:hypothetical protein